MKFATLRLNSAGARVYSRLTSHATVAPASLITQSVKLSGKKCRQLNFSRNGREKLNLASHPSHRQKSLLHMCGCLNLIIFRHKKCRNENKIFHFSAKYFLFHFTILSCFSQFFPQPLLLLTPSTRFQFARQSFNISSAALAAHESTLFIECFIRFVFFFREKQSHAKLMTALTPAQTR